MLKNIKKTIFISLAVIVGIITLFNTLYTVKPNQYVAIRQFGKVVNIVNTPGLKAKVPFIQSTQYIFSATRLYDVPLSDVITKDKKSMIADNYVLWKVTDATKYIRTLDAVDGRAEERIEAAVYNAQKRTISSMTQDELIEARNEKLNQMIEVISKYLNVNPKIKYLPMQLGDVNITYA